MRSRHIDPVIPDEVTPADLPTAARNELKTLSKENAEGVARHLAMASQLIDTDPELAHQHAVSASRRAGRIAIVRETLAITAYMTGDYALALRELRTYRRISGKDDQIALMVDSERGVGRPDRALEVGRSVDRSTLPTPVRVELAIAMSGARLDLGEPERALTELDIPELDPDRAFEWSPALFAARAVVLEELGRDEEARQWRHRAEVAEDALGLREDEGGDEVVLIEEILEEWIEEDDSEEIGVESAADESRTDEPVEIEGTESDDPETGEVTASEDSPASPVSTAPEASDSSTPTDDAKPAKPAKAPKAPKSKDAKAPKAKNAKAPKSKDAEAAKDAKASKSKDSKPAKASKSKDAKPAEDSKPAKASKSKDSKAVKDKKASKTSKVKASKASVANETDAEGSDGSR